MPEIIVETLPSGLVLAIEPMEGVSSASMSWQLPVGSAGDPPERLGESAMLNEFIARGAGGMTSREHSDALDRLGVQRTSGVGTHHLAVSATMLGSNLLAALPLFSAVVKDLALKEDGLEPSRNLCLQAIEALKDDPQQLAMIALRERHVAPPFNRHGLGDKGAIEAMTIDDLRLAWKGRAVPGGSILGVAGKVDAGALGDRLNSLLSGWKGDVGSIRETGAPPRGVTTIEQPTAQVHLGVAWDAPREADPDSVLEHLAVAVMSGGMSGRLFTEVRERRSLCYSVSASYSAGKERGLVTLYAGTTPERAQQTLDVCVAEVRRMRAGVTADEFRRAVVGQKSRLVMQGESTGARASAIARDLFRLGRARTLAERAAEIDAVKIDHLNAYLAKREIGQLTVASIGPTALTLS